MRPSQIFLVCSVVIIQWIGVPVWSAVDKKDSFPEASRAKPVSIQPGRNTKERAPLLKDSTEEPTDSCCCWSSCVNFFRESSPEVKPAPPQKPLSAPSSQQKHSRPKSKERVSFQSSSDGGRYTRQPSYVWHSRSGLDFNERRYPEG